MTILCDVCGSENHLDQEKCETCGHPIKKNVEYVICSICGLSNPNTAKSCIGCSEPLDTHNTISIEPLQEEKEPSHFDMGLETPVLETEHKAKKKNFEAGKNSKFLLYGLAAIASLVLVGFVLSLLIGDPVYLKAEDGFYYINNNQELILVDADHDEITLMSDVSSVNKVMKFGKNIYININDALYLYSKKDLLLIHDQISSFKVDLTGQRVLFTTVVDDDSYGDLYLFEEGNSKRIDAKVGLNRYIFGDKKTDIYYVTDITEEENLGVLFLKRGDDAPVKIADDVYSPVFSLKTDGVYFVRKDLESSVKFELYLANDKKVTEIGRNIIHLLVVPDSDDVLLVQEKNEVISFLWNSKDETQTIDTDIESFGQFAFGDVLYPIVYLENRALFYNKDGKTYYLNEDEIRAVSEAFTEFNLAPEKNKIFITQSNELSKATFKKGDIKDVVSVATDASYISSSKEGEILIAQYLDHQLVLIHKGVEKDIDASKDSILFSDNEKYVVYTDAGDGYAYKLGANEPIYLGENIEHMFLLDQYVYTIIDDVLYRYKLGKFSSTTELDTMKFWSELDPLY